MGVARSNDLLTRQQMPSITKIEKIQLENETEIDIARRDILRNEEQHNDEALKLVKDYYGQELICFFSQQDLPNYREYSEGKGRQGSGNSGGTDNGNNRKSPNRRADADGDSEPRGGRKCVNVSRKNVTVKPRRWITCPPSRSRLWGSQRKASKKNAPNPRRSLIFIQIRSL
jgi:hypothetical protein